MHWREIIRRPVITEKSNYLASEHSQYTFVVDSRANKLQIKEAIELAWPNVTVEKVRVSNMPAKRAKRWRRMTTRKPGYKKAIVSLLPGDSIDLFEGVI
ncbi:MAG: 50S ribosomal protein L23 [Candidatus Promineifilaceae bacterium]